MPDFFLPHKRVKVPARLLQLQTGTGVLGFAASKAASCPRTARIGVELCAQEQAYNASRLSRAQMLTPFDADLHHFMARKRHCQHSGTMRKL